MPFDRVLFICLLMGIHDFADLTCLIFKSIPKVSKFFGNVLTDIAHGFIGCFLLHFCKIKLNNSNY